jgi:CRISPR system Cascade subunit CasE
MSPSYFSLITAAEGRVHEALQQRLDGPYADHQWLWRWFPAPAGSARDFIFRGHEGAALPRYYAVSKRPPLELGGAWQVQTREYAPAIQTGDTFRFELRANPTVRHGRDGKSKRHDVVMEAKKKLLAERGLSRWADWLDDGTKPSLAALLQQSCGDWLARRGESLGFEPAPDSLIVEAHQQHRERADQSMQFTTVDFSGELRVTNAQAFLQALLFGVGSAKGMGCGLLMVRRLG